MQPLLDIKGSEEVALRQQIGELDGVVKEYKGGAVWGDAFEGWCRERGEVAAKQQT